MFSIDIFPVSIITKNDDYKLIITDLVDVPRIYIVCH